MGLLLVGVECAGGVVAGRLVRGVGLHIAGECRLFGSRILSSGFVSIINVSILEDGMDGIAHLLRDKVVFLALPVFASPNEELNLSDR